MGMWDTSHTKDINDSSQNTPNFRPHFKFYEKKWWDIFSKWGCNSNH